jgi:hypothetical protein
MDATHSFVQTSAFDEAENFFVKLRQTDSRAFIDVSNGTLLDAYSQWHAELLGGGNQQEAAEICLTYHTYIALLGVDKYKCQNEVEPVGAFITKMLQPKFKKRLAARKVVSNILQTAQSGADFRAKVLACLRSPNIVESYTYHRLKSERLALKSFENNAAGVVGKKRHVRKFIDREKLNICLQCMTGELVHLDHGETANFLFCPCQCDCYCSKKCQRDAWPTHKKFCAHAQNKREQKQQQHRAPSKKKDQDE